LDRLVIQPNNLAVQVAPAGGSGGLGAVGAYLRNLSANNVAIYVEDRDYYRTQAQAHADWGILQGNRILFPRKSGEDLQQSLVIPPGDQALAA
jgi:hypothetical protein